MGHISLMIYLLKGIHYLIDEAGLCIVNWYWDFLSGTILNNKRLPATTSTMDPPGTDQPIPVDQMEKSRFMK